MQAFAKGVIDSAKQLCFIWRSATSGSVSSTFSQFIDLQLFDFFCRNFSDILHHFLLYFLFLSSNVPSLRKISVVESKAQGWYRMFFVQCFYGRSQLQWVPIINLLAFLNFSDFLRWLATISIAAAIKICSIAEQKFCLRREEPVCFFFYLVLSIEIGVLCVPGSQQVCPDTRLAFSGLSCLSGLDQRARDISENVLWIKTIYFLSSPLVTLSNWWSPRLGKVRLSIVVVTRRILKTSFNCQLSKF